MSASPCARQLALPLVLLSSSAAISSDVRLTKRGFDEPSDEVIQGKTFLSSSLTGGLFELVVKRERMAQLAVHGCERSASEMVTSRWHGVQFHPEITVFSADGSPQGTIWQLGSLMIQLPTLGQSVIELAHNHPSTTCTFASRLTTEPSYNEW